MTLVVIVFLSLCFPLVTVFSFIQLKKRKTAGRELLAVESGEAAGSVSICQQFETVAKRKWCRVRCTFSHRNPVAEYDAEAHKYTLSIKNKENEVLFTETRSLVPFFSFCWHPEKDSTGKKPPCECDPILLDFVPPAPGRYCIDFSLKAREANSSIESFTLFVNEGIWPLKQKPYFHTCLNLVKQKKSSDQVDEKQNH